MDCLAITTGMRRETDDSNFRTLRGRRIRAAGLCPVKMDVGSEGRPATAAAIELVGESYSSSEPRCIAVRSNRATTDPAIDRLSNGARQTAYGLLTIAPRQHMIHRTGELDSRASEHEPSPAVDPVDCKIYHLTPFPT